MLFGDFAGEFRGLLCETLIFNNTLYSICDAVVEVVCLQSEALYALIEEVVRRMQEKHSVRPDRWIDDVEAMRLLGIKAKSTLQKWRDEGKIRFSQPSRKVILYDRESIEEFLQKHARNPF